MSQKTLLVTKVSKHKNPSWYKTKKPPVSKTINIYANALNSSLCISPASPFPSVNLPSRVLNLEGFSWQKGFRNPLASISYTKTYQKFLEALHLITLVRQKGGSIYVIFDGDEYRPPSSFLDPQKKDPILQNKGQYENISWSGEKWVGGTFSNFKEVSKSIYLYKTLSRQFLEVLESKISPRYFVMAKKFHGNIFSSKKISRAFLLHEQSDLWREELTKEGTKQGFSKASFAPWSYGPAERAKEGRPPVGPSNQQPERLWSNRWSSSNQGLQGPATTTKANDHKKQSKKNVCFLKKKKNYPDLIIVENGEKYKNVIAEAKTLKIPVVAFVESDILSNISIALPLNALKHYFLAFLLYIIYKIPSN